MAQLVPSDAVPPAWLRVVHDEEALFAAVDVERLRRARLHDEREPDRGLGQTPAQEPRPFVVVVPGPVDAGVASRLLDSSPRGFITVLAVCDDAPLRIEKNGRVDDGGVRVAVLAEDKAAAVLGTLTGEQPAAEVPPALLTPAGDEVTAEVVSLRLLGAFGITVAGREVFARLRSKGRELLALLAVNREGITADAAMEALWPGATTDPAYFRTVVANLRTVLRDEAGPDEPTPVVERLGQRYRLNPARVDVDLWRFEDALSAAARGDDEAAEAAASTYRGDLLDGEDWPWADPVRERLRRRAVDNLTALAERRRAAGQLDAALHAAERAVERDPYAEELYQRVMTLHRDLGRPDGARRTYEVLEARLRDLGVTPNPTSRALGNGAEA